MRGLELAVHYTIVITVATLCALLFDGTLFSYHPTLMSIGFLALMSEGVLTALKFRQLEGQQRVAAIQRHFYIQLVAALAVSAAFYAIYRNKVIHGKAHFKTTHGKLGFATLLLAFVAPLGGALSFKKFGLINALPEALHGTVKYAHRKVGLVTWLMALLTVQLQLTHPAVFKGAMSHFWRVAVGALGLLVFAFAFTEPTGKRSQAGEFQMLSIAGGDGEREEQLAKTL